MENTQKDLAWHIIVNTDTNLFLTGKAGTGKTTFLRELRTAQPKRMVVVAPTGIAAINAQGVTIHSFFQLGFGPQVPGMKKDKKKQYQFRKHKIQLLKSIDLVVIDEISMVRADVLDAIDEVLRKFRNRYRPFGGVQMLLIGDMQQLAPVAKEEEWQILKEYYDTPYFFSSRALQQSDFVTVELNTVYRQNDPLFLGLLNKVRTNTADAETLAELNKRYIADFKPKDEEGYIRLTTHNKQADAINRRELDALEEKPCFFEAKIVKDFPELSYPTDKTLELKVGAQVMFIKNDSSPKKQYYNGMIGEVVEFEDDIIRVRTKDEYGDIIEVGRETWENTRYTIDKETKEIEETVVGTFTQYPLKTAWAITVHKSQGLTFEKAIIDVQYSFAHGQTYVALSRCKSLEGMVLSAPIPAHAIINDQKVEDFAHDPRHQQPDTQRLDLMERYYMLRTIEDLFDFTLLRYGFDAAIRLMREHFYTKSPKTYAAWMAESDKLKDTERVAARFHNQYQKILFQPEDYRHNKLLQERLKKGAAYFMEQIGPVRILFEKSNLQTDNKAVKERRDNILNDMKDNFKLKFQLLHHVSQHGLDMTEYPKFKAKTFLKIDDSSKK